MDKSTRAAEPNRKLNPPTNEQSRCCKRLYPKCFSLWRKGREPTVKKQKRNELNQADFGTSNSKLNRIKPIAVAVGYVAFLIWAWYVLMAPKV